MSSTYPDLALPQPIPYVPVCIPPAVLFEDPPVLEEVGKGETPQSQTNVCKISLKDRILNFISVTVLNSIFQRFMSILSGFWAAFVAFGILCSLSLNFVCKPAIQRCLRKRCCLHSRSVKSGGKSARSAKCSSTSAKARTTRWRRIIFPRCSLHDHIFSLSGLAVHGLGGQCQGLQWILTRFGLFLFLTTLDVIFFQDAAHQNDKHLLYYDVKRFSFLMLFGSNMIWLVSLSIFSVTYHCIGSLLQGIASVFRACSAAFSFALCDGELAPDVAGLSGRRSRRSRRRSRKRSTSRTRSNRSPQIRINAYSMENEYSARNCIFCLILLGLMCATLSPASRDFDAEKIEALERVIQ